MTVIKQLSVATVAGIFLSLLTVGKTFAYTFTKIADTRDSSFRYIGFDGPAINNEGIVAFEASLDAMGNNGIFIGSGGAITTVVGKSSSFGPQLGNPTINNAATVAFVAERNMNELGIFTNSGGVTNTIAAFSGSPPYLVRYFNRAIDINDNGTVAFVAIPDAIEGLEGVFTSNGEETTTIVDNTGTLKNLFRIPTINNDGTVAFAAELRAGGQGLFTYNNGVITTIAQTGRPFDIYGSPVINNEGTIAFGASQGNTRGIYTSKDGVITTIGDDSGSFNYFEYMQFLPALNDRGTVAFKGFLDAGGEGIFTGSDPVTDKVIAFGDTLSGSTVRSLILSYNGLNNFGQIAFWAEFTDGTSGVFRADPGSKSVPEPAFVLGLLIVGVLGIPFRYKLLRSRVRSHSG